MEKRLIRLFVVGFVVFALLFYFVQGAGILDNSQWGWNLTAMNNGAISLGDLNNDNLTDLILTGIDASVRYAKVYINNGTSLEESRQWQWNLTAMDDSSLALGDIDNDGDLDLGLLGWDGTTRFAKIYINNGSSFEESRQWEWNLTGGKDSTILFGDVNNDGRLDFITGNPKFRVYLNNGTSFNEDIGWGKNVQTELSTGTGDGRTESIDLGDYDNDGKLDIIVAGHDNGDPRNKLFKNNGTSFVLDVAVLNEGRNSCDTSFGDIDNDGDLDLVELGAFFAAAQADVFINENGTLSYNSSWASSLADTKEGGLALGDYNNDGKLDLLWTGNYMTKVYNNTGVGFSEDTIFDTNLSSLTYSSVVWIDIDKDGDLDSILIGYCGGAGTCFKSKVYISNASLYRNNSAPSMPSAFQNYSLSNGNVFIGWGNTSDNETTSLGLYYNLRVGTTTGGNEIVSGVFVSGGRGGAGGGQNGQFGNMMQRRNISLSGSRFSVGTTYYWSVQTIDTGLAKSAWSTEQTFTLTSDFTPPVVALNAPSGVANQTMNIVFNASVYDDYNLTNVSLYGNWSGWHINQTNASGINNTDYIFKANLTEGNWLWGIRACDATNNCRGSNSTFRIDITYPIVALVSPANGTSQTSSNSVTFTYNVSDVAINNCTLYLNGAANETDTSIIVSTSRTFAENVPNGAYNWSVRCADAANNINTAANFSLTVSYTPDTTPPSTSSGGGGGGGGGAVSAVLTKVTRIIAAITEGNNLIEFAESEKASVGIEEILLDSAAAASNVKLTIEKLAAMPVSISTSPLGDVYSYLQFNKTVLKDEDVKQAKITFSVAKDWIAKNALDYNKIVLQRYTTKWSALPTAYLKQNASNYYYQATTPGFSVFAITAEKKAGAEKIESSVNESEQEKEIGDIITPTHEISQQQPMMKKKFWGYLTLALLGMATIVVIIIMNLKKNKRATKNHS